MLRRSPSFAIGRIRFIDVVGSSAATVRHTFAGVDCIVRLGRGELAAVNRIVCIAVCTSAQISIGVRLCLNYSSRNSSSKLRSIAIHSQLPSYLEVDDVLGVNRRSAFDIAAATCYHDRFEHATLARFRRRQSSDRTTASLHSSAAFASSSFRLKRRFFDTRIAVSGCETSTDLRIILDLIDQVLRTVGLLRSESIARSTSSSVCIAESDRSNHLRPTSGFGAASNVRQDRTGFIAQLQWLGRRFVSTFAARSSSIVTAVSLSLAVDVTFSIRFSRCLARRLIAAGASVGSTISTFSPNSSSSSSIGLAAVVELHVGFGGRASWRR